MTPFFQKTRDLRPALVIAWAPVWLRGELEHGSLARSAAFVDGAIEIARRVPDQTSVRVFAVRPGEGVQHGLGAIRSQLEHRPQAESATGPCGAIEIARRVPDQTCEGLRPVSAVREGAEAMQHSLLVRRIQLEDRPVAGLRESWPPLASPFPVFYA